MDEDCESKSIKNNLREAISSNPLRLIILIIA